MFCGLNLIFTHEFNKTIMKKILIGTIVFLFSCTLIAQLPEKIYATMDAANAASFYRIYPDEIEILEVLNSQAAVLMTQSVSRKIHENVTTHGPGYIFQDSEAKALAALQPVVARRPMVDFTITEDAFVNACLDLVNSANIEATIWELEDYGTRYHTKPQAEQAVLDQQAKWNALIAASGRSDISTRIVEHMNTPMPSVILTFTGADNPNEFIIIGGHIDSTAWPSKDDAPGADDNASGIASLNEMVRVLMEQEFVPSRTVEVMAFAAEEIGLVGSAEIAASYAANNINVLAYVQFDMTGYKGSVEDIYITQDSYNSSSLNTYLVSLMDHYNAAGPHSFTYGFTSCGYGCSDHASWAANGYEAAFPIEAKMGEDNPFIHTPNDVYSFFNTPDHSAKFTKLGLQFVIEAAKSASLSTEDFSENAVSVFVKDKSLNYRLKNLSTSITAIHIYNALGQQIHAENLKTENGIIGLEQYANGFYILKFTLENNLTVSKKIVLN